MGITSCASLPSSSSYLLLRINNSHHSRNLEFGFLPFRSSLSDSALNLNRLIMTPNEQHILFSSSKSLSACSPTLLWQFDVRVRASSVPEFAGERPKSGGIVQTLNLGLMFGLWYLFNIYFNIYNKQLLRVFPCPMTITSFYFFLGSIITLLLWGSNVYKKPKYTATQLLLIVPLALTHTFGNLFTNMSIGKVAVSFTHTIKAMEPFFSVLLSALFLGEMPSVWVLSSLVPVVGGVVLASLTEASFNWAGFLSAMASNVTNQSRNVFSKKLMVKEKKQDAMANINLFSVITIMSFFVLTATALFVEGVKFTPTYLQSTVKGINVNEIYLQALIAGLCFHASQQVSYMILGKVSPVTHSVANCVKRVIVIVTSVIFFHTQVSPKNALGTGVALAGVFLYSRAKRTKEKTH